jgi:hypothetical protein
MLGSSVAGEKRPSPSTATRWLAAVVVALPLIWAIVTFGLRPDRGLELADEGLYLLEAQPPTPTATWATPYGWHTRLLFRLVGYDVAAFRSVGAWLLLVAVVYLALAAVSFGEQRRAPNRSPDHAAAAPQAWLTTAMAGIVGVLGGWLYYAGMVRTPSYNWLTVLGAVIATIGALQLLGRSDDRSFDDAHGKHRVTCHLWTFTIAVGLFLSLPAKPTTPAFFVLLFTPAALRILGPRRSFRAAVLIAGYALALLGLALATRVWPLSFPEIFLRAVRTPTPYSAQSLGGAVREFALLPVRAVQAQPLVAALVAVPALRLVERRAITISVRWRYPILGFALSSSAAWLLLVPSFLRWAYSQTWTDAFFMRDLGTTPIEVYLDSVAGFRLGLPILLLVSVAILWPGVGVKQKRRAAQLMLLVFAVIAMEPQRSVLFGGEGSLRFVSAQVTTSLLLLFGSLLVGFTTGSRRDGPGDVAEQDDRTIGLGTLPLVAGTLIVLAFATGFGSGHFPYPQASLASALLVAASLVLISGIRDRGTQSYALFSMLPPLVLLGAVVWADNQVHPYRIEPMAEQNVATSVGADGAVLFLDPARHELLNDLERTAGEAGWQPGNRLFGLAAPWSSTIPWHLGATVPDSIMPTLEANPERLAFNLTWWDLEGWQDAWILTTPKTAPDPSLHQTTTAQAREVAGAVGRSFPTDYTSVWTSVDPTDDTSNYELWRPNP